MADLYRRVEAMVEQAFEQDPASTHMMVTLVPSAGRIEVRVQAGRGESFVLKPGRSVHVFERPKKG